ncbi:Uncharacterised protein [Actinobaculum suis]|uniref:Single-stranded DNA-binding protein n=1 Tax=Actinobaculum suis TaxID=1657 RepID=A0A7Z9C906_9ACTO|nr:hypothetical protein [Actinobaculum suis]VDG75786.1 Uncharacterised protein [Actinobaculum suis]
MKSIIAVIGRVKKYPRESRAQADTCLSFSVTTTGPDGHELRISVRMTGPRARHARELFKDYVNTRGNLDVPVIVYGHLYQQGKLDAYGIEAEVLAIDTFEQWVKDNE